MWQSTAIRLHEGRYEIESAAVYCNQPTGWQWALHVGHLALGRVLLQMQSKPLLFVQLVRKHYAPHHHCQILGRFSIYMGFFMVSPTFIQFPCVHRICPVTIPAVARNLNRINKSITNERSCLSILACFMNFVEMYYKRSTLKTDMEKSFLVHISPYTTLILHEAKNNLLVFRKKKIHFTSW
jgi:hypothetical protein